MRTNLDAGFHRHDELSFRVKRNFNYPDGDVSLRYNYPAALAFSKTVGTI
jgi:hypothetical protein